MKTVSMIPSADDVGASDLNRRKFIQVGSVATLATYLGLATVSTASAAELGVSASGASRSGRIYRAGSEGQIVVSDDNERTWQVHANFGADHTVRSVTHRKEAVVAEIGFGSRTFELHLHKSGNFWISSVR